MAELPKDILWSHEGFDLIGDFLKLITDMKSCQCPSFATFQFIASCENVPPGTRGRSAIMGMGDARTRMSTLGILCTTVSGHNVPKTLSQLAGSPAERSVRRSFAGIEILVLHSF